MSPMVVLFIAMSMIVDLDLYRYDYTTGSGLYGWTVPLLKRDGRRYFKWGFLTVM